MPIDGFLQYWKKIIRCVPMTDKETAFSAHVASPTLLSYFNSKGLIFSSGSGYHLPKER
jgi:hypothetical protein